MSTDLSEFSFAQRSPVCTRNSWMSPSIRAHRQKTASFKLENPFAATSSRQWRASDDTSPKLMARTSSFGSIGSSILSPHARLVSLDGSLAGFMHSELGCDEASDSLRVRGAGCRRMPSIVVPVESSSNAMSCSSPSFASLPPLSPERRRMSNAPAQPLLERDVHWLLSTLGAADLAQFDRGYFMQDARIRFAELDTNKTGLLGIDQLQAGLVHMYPTLKLELNVAGHRIPALSKSIPRVIATFDSDHDGYLDFGDFLQFVKFQHAWRAQFYLHDCFTKNDVSEKRTAGIRKTTSTPMLPSLLLSQTVSQGKDGCPAPKRQGKTRGRSRSGAKKRSPSAGSTSSGVSTRCPSVSSSTSVHRKSALSSSRGAFYSTFMGMQSAATDASAW